MSATIGKRIAKWAYTLAPWILCLMLAAGWALSVWTPDYLERLIPELAAKMQIPLADFQIRKAGLWRANIGPVRLGEAGDDLKLNSIDISYSPTLLKAGRVDRITLTDMEFVAGYNGTTFELPLLDLFPQSDGAERTEALPDLPFSELVVENSVCHFQYLGTRLSVPFDVTLTAGDVWECSGALRIRDQRIQFSGRIGPSLDKVTVHLDSDAFHVGSVSDLLPIPFSGVIGVRADAVVSLKDSLAVTADAVLSLKKPNLPGSGIVLAPESVIDMTAELKGGKATLSVSPVQLVKPYPVTIRNAHGHFANEAIQAEFVVDVAGISLPGTVQASANGSGWDGSVQFAASENLQVQTAGRAIKLGGLKASLQGTMRSDAADCVLSVESKSVRLAGTGVRSGPISLRLPLAWPFPKRHAPGEVRVTSLRNNAMRIGNVRAKLRQEKSDISFAGALSSHLLPKLRVDFSGKGSMTGPDAQIVFSVPKYVLPQNYDPVALVPALGGTLFSGTLSLEGGVTMSQDGLTSRLGVFLSGGKAVFGESGTEMNGIKLYFESPDLFDFHSAPAQMFAFDSLVAGGIRVEEGVVTFQVEKNGVVLVERGRFKWCDGFVESRAFRVVPGLDEYDVTLFCTNLKLTQLLHQLGLAKARGDSALSGELPVTWKSGQISFNNGFLHSTPGQGGVIQVEAMEDLLESIPKGTPQRGQLELARAAVKDFEYKWVRLKADTVGRDLLVRLSVDGKPASTLPFVYRKEFGGFAMVEGDVQGSNFQGLRLDVNFKLPLDRILLYKNLIERIE